MLRNQVVFSHWFFLDFGANLDGFWDPSWAPTNISHPGFFASCVQEAPKRLQERPKGVSRASNSLPRGPQECPRAIKTCPGRAQGASKGSLFWGFPCFSMLFCVFLSFPAFFLRFSVYFCVFLQRTPVNFSTLSSKLNCVRQQAKASKASRSKPKEAKASKSQLESKFKISSRLDRACVCQARSSVELILNLNSKRFGK